MSPWLWIAGGGRSLIEAVHGRGVQQAVVALFWYGTLALLIVRLLRTPSARLVDRPVNQLWIDRYHGESR